MAEAERYPRVILYMLPKCGLLSTLTPLAKGLWIDAFGFLSPTQVHVHPH